MVSYLRQVNISNTMLVLHVYVYNILTRDLKMVYKYFKKNVPTYWYVDA